MDDALAAGVAEPHAMTLSTVDAEGRPDARTLILKDVDRLGWAFARRRIRRAERTLQTAQARDVLPVEQRELDGVGRLLGFPDRGAMLLEEDYLRVTRRARRVLETYFCC